jgi:hypothetical protein
MVLMLDLSEASPRWRHWRDAASATRQAKSGDGGHDLSEYQAPEVRWAAVSHQESCCLRFEPVRARAHLERVHASPPASGYIHWGCPKHARPSRSRKTRPLGSWCTGGVFATRWLHANCRISGPHESIGLGIENLSTPRDGLQGGHERIRQRQTNRSA